MESLNFNGIVNGFISDKELTGYTTIENVREMIVCVSKNIFKKGSVPCESNQLQIHKKLCISIWWCNLCGKWCVNS